MTPEGRVKALIKRKMDERFPGHYVFKPVINGMGKRGLDGFYCIQGLFVSIEAKRAGADLTDIQRDTAAEIIKAGGLVFRVDGKERLDAAIAFISQAVAQRNCERQGDLCAGNRRPPTHCRECGVALPQGRVGCNREECP